MTTSRAHIREAIRYALWEKSEIATKSDSWYASSCTISREWRDKARNTSVKTLAREHLDYWRMRAFLHGVYGPGDRPARDRWIHFSEESTL